MRNYLARFPELVEFLADIENVLHRSQLPPEAIIMDDFDVCKMLKISKRKLAQLRADRLIEFYRTGINRESHSYMKSNSRKRAGKIYYTLQNILDYLNRFKVKPITRSKKLGI